MGDWRTPKAGLAVPKCLLIMADNVSLPGFQRVVVLVPVYIDCVCV